VGAALPFSAYISHVSHDRVGAGWEATHYAWWRWRISRWWRVRAPTARIRARELPTGIEQHLHCADVSEHHGPLGVEAAEHQHVRQGRHLQPRCRVEGEVGGQRARMEVVCTLSATLAGQRRVECRRDTGLIWLECACGCMVGGRRAGCRSPHGYRRPHRTRTVGSATAAARG